MDDIDLLTDDGEDLVVTVENDRKPVGPVAVQESLGVTSKGRGKQGPKAKCWCGTWNNPSLDGADLAKILNESEKIELAVFQLEVGENGTPHFQMYIELKDRGFHTAVRKAMGEAGDHVALFVAKGRRNANFDYCTKEDTRSKGPWYVKCEASDGKKAKQGKRTDLDEFTKMVLEEGGVTEHVIESFPGHCVQFMQKAQGLVNHVNVLKAQEEEMAHWAEMWERSQNGEDIADIGIKPRYVELLFGPTAMGKSTHVKLTVMGRDKEPLFEKPAQHKWWDSYRKQPNVLIDEFHGEGFGTIETFNNFLNEGEKLVEVKNGSLSINPKKVFLTTNSHPSHWWSKGNGVYANWEHGEYRDWETDRKSVV